MRRLIPASLVLSIIVIVLLARPVGDGEQRREETAEHEIENINSEEDNDSLFYSESIIGRERESMFLNVAYPPEQEPFYYYGEALFLFGSVNPGIKIELTVNGHPVDRYDPRSGNFLTMVDLTRGKEELINVKAATLTENIEIYRKVLFPDFWTSMPENPLAVHPARQVPSQKIVLKEGDLLQVAFQGSPKATASYSVGDTGIKGEMIEYLHPNGPPGPGGYYHANYMIGEADLPSRGLSSTYPIRVLLERGDEKIEHIITGSLVVMSGSTYAFIEVKPERELKNKGWLYTFNPGQSQLVPETYGGAGFPTSVTTYLVEGTRFRAVGAFGGFYRVEIGGSDNYLINGNAVRELAEYNMEKSHLTGAAITFYPNCLQFRLSSSERFPFLVNDLADGIEINFSDAVIDEEVIKSGTPGLNPGFDFKFLEQSDQGPWQLSVNAGFNLAGYKTWWDGTDLIIDLYEHKKIDANNPLRGKRIIVDPGHGGTDSGAIGPGELQEKDVVLAMGLLLKDLLEAAGAEIIMTRDDDLSVNLYDRPEEIDSYDADLFISIHVNAHADGALATDHHGLMILYNYAHNKKLAEIMLEVMADKTDLPPFRTWRRNVAVLRHTQLPSVLVEAGYLMHPYDNWYILNPEGQEQLAGAMYSGIEQFFLKSQKELR